MDRKIKQIEFFYEVSSNSLSGYGGIMFDDIKIYSREVTKTSNTIAFEKRTFVSEKNKENLKEVEKKKQEEAKEQERLSHYHSGLEAYYALFPKLLEGDYISRVPVNVLQVIGNDGFLAYFAGDTDLLFYVVSKGIEGNNELTDGMDLYVYGQIIGRHKYISTGGGQRTIPKVKASELDPLLKTERKEKGSYHDMNGAYYALFGKLLVGDYISRVPVNVLQAIGNDGFLAYYAGYDGPLFYIVSKGIKGNNKLTDGMLLYVDGQIIGRHKYISTHGGQKTIPKVKASKLEPFQ
jgi:hypothetical protein